MTCLSDTRPGSTALESAETCLGVLAREGLRNAVAPIMKQRRNPTLDCEAEFDHFRVGEHRKAAANTKPDNVQAAGSQKGERKASSSVYHLPTRVDEHAALPREQGCERRTTLAHVARGTAARIVPARHFRLSTTATTLQSQTEKSDLNFNLVLIHYGTSNHGRWHRRPLGPPGVRLVDAVLALALHMGHLRNTRRHGAEVRNKVLGV